jgi:hypothetical protein
MTLLQLADLPKSRGPQARFKLASALAFQLTAIAFGSAPAMAVTITGFTGAFAPSNWAFSNQGTSSRFSNNGTTLTFIGEQNNFPEELSSYTYRIIAPFTGNVTFNWANTVTSFSGDETSGALSTNNSQFERLSGFLDLTAGANTFSIQAGEEFGFFSSYASNEDCCGTTTNQTITSFSATSATAVPGPLPILGLPAVLFYSRKLKKRIKASREASSKALV